MAIGHGRKLADVRGTWGRSTTLQAPGPPAHLPRRLTSRAPGNYTLGASWPGLGASECKEGVQAIIIC